MFESKIGYWVKKKDMKLKYIANELEVSYQTVSNWCTGRSLPDMEKTFLLARLLNIKVDELGEMEEQENE